MNVYIKTETGRVIKIFDVTGKSDRHIAKLVAGIEINLGDDYHVEVEG